MCCCYRLKNPLINSLPSGITFCFFKSRQNFSGFFLPMFLLPLAQVLFIFCSPALCEHILKFLQTLCSPEIYFFLMVWGPEVSLSCPSPKALALQLLGDEFCISAFQTLTLAFIFGSRNSVAFQFQMIKIM